MPWRCAECGEVHEDDTPPCTACGYHSFVEANEGSDGSAGSDGSEAHQGLVWACTECGRHHQKHSPPCNRCGNVHLEKRQPDYSDLEAPGGTSYLDVLELKYAVGYLAVAGFAVLVALSLAGIVSVPFLDGPTPPGAPGNAGTYENVSLQAVEDAYVETVNERRAARGVDAIRVDASLDDAATALNQRLVRSAANGEDPPEIREVLRRYEPDCDGPVRPASETAPGSSVFGGDGDTDAATVAGTLPIQPTDDSSALLSNRSDAIGVDVHVAPDGTVFSTVIVC